MEEEELKVDKTLSKRPAEEASYLNRSSLNHIGIHLKMLDPLEYADRVLYVVQVAANSMPRAKDLLEV